MPEFGYNHMANGALTPYEMHSILGGALYLLPNPDDTGWLTWGFDPYSPGEDQYQQTAQIPAGAALMRVPTKYVMDGDNGDDSFAAYLANSAARCHEALQRYIDGLDVETVKDAEFARRMGQAVTQLGNVMVAINILNSALSAQGVEPLRPQFGNRYKAKPISTGGEVITQAMVTDYVVADLWTEEVAASGYGDLESAQHAARRMNDKARDKWVKQEINGIAIPEWVDNLADDGVIGNPVKDIQDYLIEHGFGLGDVLTDERLFDTINYLWRRPLLVPDSSMVYFMGVVGDEPRLEPERADVMVQVAYTDEGDEEFFGGVSLVATSDQPWLLVTEEVTDQFTLSVDLSQVGAPGLYNAVVTITEERDKVRNNNVKIPVTLSVADPTPTPAIVVEDDTVDQTAIEPLNLDLPTAPQPDFPQEVDEG